MWPFCVGRGGFVAYFLFCAFFLTFLVMFSGGCTVSERYQKKINLRI